MLEPFVDKDLKRGESLSNKSSEQNRFLFRRMFCNYDGKQMTVSEFSKGNARMGNGQPCILAIDLGSSGTKVCLINVQGEILAYEFQKISTYYRDDKGVEQDPKEWWSAITESIRKIVKAHPKYAANITTISCCAQWSGTIGVDAHGEALGYAIVGKDVRGAHYIEDVVKGALSKDGYSLRKLWTWVRKSGACPRKSGKDPLAHILFLKEKKTYAYIKAYKFLEPKDFLNLKFTGKYAASYDSIALHWITDNRKIQNVRYDKQLLNFVGLDIQKFPDLYKATDILGPIRPDLAKELGLPDKIQVVVGGAEPQAGAVGCGAVHDYAPHLHIGSSSWLTCHVPFKRSSLHSKLATLPSALPGRYFIANEHEAAGVCLDYLWETFAGVSQKVEGSTPSYERLDFLAKDSVPGSRRVLFTPWFHDDTSDHSLMRGGFHNLSLVNNSSDIARSVYEGVAYNSKWLLSSIEKFLKRKLNTIAMIGGGAKSDLWCQIHADILNRKILQIQDPHLVNVRGAAWIGAIAMGYINAESIPNYVEVKKEYLPAEEDQELYTQSFKEFVQIYKTNKKIYQRMNAYN